MCLPHPSFYKLKTEVQLKDIRQRYNPDMMTPACNPTLEAEAGGSGVWGLLGIPSGGRK